MHFIVVYSHQLITVIRPPLLFLFLQCSQHLEYGAIEPFASTVPLGMIWGGSGPVDLLQHNSECIWVGQP